MVITINSDYMIITMNSDYMVITMNSDYMVITMNSDYMVITMNSDYSPYSSFRKPMSFGLCIDGSWLLPWIVVHG